MLQPEGRLGYRGRLDMYDWLRRVLSHPRARRWVVALSILLVAPSLFAGLGADDFVHELVLSGTSPIAGFRHSPFDLFRFATPSLNRSLMNDGVFPWWIDPDVRFAFLRPLAAASHVLDHAVAPGNAFVMHVQNVLWATLSVVAVGALYRAVLGPTWVSALALLLYAVDDARGAPVTWVANRSELIACALSVAAALLYRRGAAGDQRSSWLGPLVFGIALAASEGAIAITPYLFAHEVFLENSPWSKRLTRLAPYALVTVAWFSLYRALGYGVSGSGVYFDPLKAPAAFIGALPGRFGALWFSALGGPWSEGYNVYPVLAPGFAPLASPLAALTIAANGFLFAPLIRRDRAIRAFLLGAALATVPACAAFPADRLLPWAAIGIMGATAQFIGAFVEGALPDAGLYGFAARVVVPVMIAVHLVFGPLLLPLRSMGIRDVRETIGRADAGIPKTSGIEKRVVVVMNAPADPMASYVTITRAALGEPRPRALRWLVSGPGPVYVDRIDDRSLRVKAEGGFIRLPSEALFRSVRDRPFSPGDEVELSDMRVTVTSVGPEGGPTEVLARFERPLEDPTYLWLAWKGAGYAAFSPPPVGARVTLPETNYFDVAYPPDSIAARHFGSPNR
jgi:hypothetical protein